jgi:signal transduction histidine kinase
MMTQTLGHTSKAPRPGLWSLLGLALAVLLVLATCVISWRAMATFVEAGGSVARSRAALETLETVRSAVHEVEATTRGYVLMGDDALFEAARAARQRTRLALANVRSLVRNDPPQLRRLEALEPLVLRELEHNLALAEMRRSNALGPVTLREDALKPAADAPAQGIAAMRAEERSRLEQHLERADLAAREARAALIALAALAGLLLVAIYALMARGAAQRARAAAERGMADAQVEARIQERTAEMSAAQETLISEIEGRHGAGESQRRSERRMHQAQRLEAVGRLAGGVAHDFNNLLTAILGYCQLMKRRLGPDDPAWQDTAQIEKAADSAAGLTRQMLAFSRQQVLQPRVLDLNELVMGMDTMLRRIVGLEVELKITLGRELGHVEADPGQLKQVLLNLAVNARDAMPIGGRLTIGTDNVTLDDVMAAGVGGLASGSYVVLTVADTGCGMDEETRAHVFEPFFTTKDMGRASGLGLSTVHGIVEQSAGRIEVASEPGKGSTFRILLPQVASALHPPAPAFDTPGIEGGTESILLVEDEPQVRAVVRAMLTLSGYTVIEACDGAEAFSLCEQFDQPIDVMLTDVALPIMSGPDLAKHVALLRPGLKVVYMSGYTEKASIQHGALGPEAAFLQKPFSVEDLLRKVRQVLDDRAQAA